MDFSILALSISTALVLTSVLGKKGELGYLFILGVGGFIGVVTGFILSRLYLIFKLDFIIIAILNFCLVPGLLILVILSRFYRDPVRTPPPRDNVIVSPADGKIRYIRKIEAGTIPTAIKGRKNIKLEEIVKGNIAVGDGYIIGITMSILDVHVNRAPISGEVLMTKYTPGRFLSLKKPDSETLNERNTIIIKGEIKERTLEVGIVQIASRLVRRIECYVKKGERLTIGQKIGMIKFGSQVDLILQEVDGLRILVREGDQVYAGKTIIAELL